MTAKSIIIQPSNSFPPNPRRIENWDTAFQIIISLMILSTLGIVIYAGILKSRQQSVSFNPYSKVPCRRCRYFSDNQFLKCTLHPTTALTGQAVDCRDYCPHNAEKRFEKESNASLHNLSWRSIVQNIFNK
jgi:hypothetical protein